MKFRVWRAIGLLFFWATVYAVFAPFPEGWPLPKWVCFYIVAILSSIFLSIEEDK